MKILPPHGPRGMFMLGFGITSATLGTSILISGSRSRSLAWLTEFLPYQVFGILWLIVGVWLVGSAFSIKQSKAISALAGMCFMWGTAYLIADAINLFRGGMTGVYITAFLFYGISLACGAAVRMVNPASSHLEVVKKAGPPPDEQGKPHG